MFCYTQTHLILSQMNLYNHHSSNPQIYHQVILPSYMEQILVLYCSHLEQKSDEGQSYFSLFNDSTYCSDVNLVGKKLCTTEFLDSVHWLVF